MEMKINDKGKKVGNNWGQGQMVQVGIGTGGNSCWWVMFMLC